MPQFSIIIPTYNPDEKILRTLESVEAQTFRDFEVIIVDDGSENNVQELIIRYLLKDNYQYHRQENKGPSAARNEGVKKANGDWVYFLDADDEIMMDTLAIIHGLIVNHKTKNVGLISGSIRIPYFEETRKPKLINGQKNKRVSSLAGSFCVNSSAFRNHGGYDSSIRQSENSRFIADFVQYCRLNNLEILSNNKIWAIYHKEMDRKKYLERQRLKINTLKKDLNSNGINAKQKAQNLQSIGIAYFRLDNRSQAKSAFLSSIRIKPTIFINYVRLMACIFPFIGTKIWKRSIPKQ